MEPKPLVAILGQTASGKSALAIKLAKKYNGEIICADSRTIYKEMDIGTAKPSIEDRKIVPHYGLDLITPDQKYSAAEFKGYALSKIQAIHQKGKVPFLVGGTGLYIDATLYNFGFSAASEGASKDKQNPRHLDKNAPRPRDDLRKNTLIIGIKLDKEILKKRIEERAQKMISSGFLNEVEKLLNKYGEHAPGLLAPGYKAMLEYNKGSINLDEAKNMFIGNDKRLAKRQMTWFKRNKDINWVQTFGQADRLVQQFLIQ